MNNNFTHKSNNKIIYRIIYIYYFALALLMVTPAYYYLNPLSIGVSLICLTQLHTISRDSFSHHFVIYILQFLVLLVNLLFLKHQETGFYGLLSLFKNVITAIIPALFIIDFKKLRNALIAFILGGIINIIVNLITGLSSFDAGGRHMADNLLTLNSFGHASLIYLLCIFLLYYLIERRIVKLLLITFAFMIVLSMIITGSRQSFVALAGFMIMHQLLSLSKFSFKKIISFLGMFLLLLFGSYLTYLYFPNSPIIVRFKEGGVGDDSRLTMYQTAWDLFMEQPFTGYGISAFKHYSYYVYTHSSYAEILFTSGIIVAILYFVFYTKFLIITKKMIKYSVGLFEKRVYILIFSITIALLINGLFYLVHQSRLALTFQFLLVNFVYARYRNTTNGNYNKHLKKN